MSVNLSRSYPQVGLKGKATEALRLPEGKACAADIVNKSWPHNSLDFYIWLEVGLSEVKEELRAEVGKVLASQRNRCQQTSMAKLVLQLRDWLRIIKKIEFYHIDTNTKDLFYAENGLLALYECGNLQTIYLLSEIEKYRSKNAEEEGLTLSDLRRDQMQIIYRDVCLKISRHLLSQLKNEMYYPSKELVTKLLRFYGFSYDFTRSFQENYQNALVDKKVTSQDSRQAVIILFTFKMICAFQSLQEVCYYISYLKNILLDRSNGVLTAEYETWLLLYEACLKIFCRYQTLREQEAIEIDQILSSSFIDAEFHGFLLRHALQPNVTLSSINFYIKNCRREEKEELKSHVLAKIETLIEENFWKYLEDIFEYVENELEGEQREQYICKIKNRVIAVVNQEITAQKLYEVEYGLTFILENLVKHIQEFSQIITNDTLKDITFILKSNPPLEKTTILFRFFSQFITILYSETSYEAMNLPSAQDLLFITSLFQEKNFLCHKSVYKFIYYQLSSEEYGEEVWDSFFVQLAQLYFCGGYDQNADLEVIHSHESYRECIATKILQAFQLLICSQISQRKELVRCVESTDLKLKQAYFTVRGFKDSLLFESIQNICLIFNSHLSMQTLEFGLNYCTPFAHLVPWRSDEPEMTLLSLICQEMPIETLKFIFKEVCDDSSFDTRVLEQISAEFWSVYWNVDRQECGSVFGREGMGVQKLEALQSLRRFEFILSLACCVFDKLNENSQKNIKEIKIIYEQAATKVIDIANKLKRSFLEALNIATLRRVEGLSGEEVRNLELVDDATGSFMLTNYISKNSFLSLAKEFNLIGKINESQKVVQVEEALLPNIKQLKFIPKDKSHEVIYKQIELCLNIEASYLKKIVECEAQSFAFEVQVSKDWARHIFSNATSLTTLLRKEKGGQSVSVLCERINDHIKCLLSKVLLPELLSFLLVGECKPALSKHLFPLMRAAIELIYTIDSDYQEHFIVLIEKIEELFRDSKGRQVQSQYILSLLELFFELIFNRIRIRSYHIYRIIKYYQRVTGEAMEQFNSVIAQHIRVLFQEFITNYKSIGEMQRLCSPRRTLTTTYARFARHDHTLNYIETACTLSMFINLFCRLNYPSLTLGIEKTFGQEEAKAIYIDYLSSLTRKIVTEHIDIAPRDLEILKIDVYGNLNIITQGRLSERLVNKLISLAKNLLRVKVDLRGVNKLPIKILADKIAAEHLQINLEEFEDECKAISLGAISVHKKLAVFVSSNLHLCNLYYVTGRNFQKYIELNHMLLPKNRQELAQEVDKVTRQGLTALNVQIGEEITIALEGLMRKLEKYYEICGKDVEYAEKLYSIFKILCISSLNNPEILPLLLAQRLNVNKTQITFFDFVFLTLKTCLPLFCEFYTTVIKTNCGFVRLSDDQLISKNLQYQLSIRRKLLCLLKGEISKKESSYLYLTKAINYVQQYSESNRFRFYKFVKNTNEIYQAILKEYEREFNLQLISTCDQYIRKGYTSFSCFEVYELLEVAMERTYAQGSSLDLRKLFNEEQIKKIYYSQKEHENNKENIEMDRKSRETDTARSKQHDTTLYRPLLSQIMLPSACSTVGRTCKAKKAKDIKQLRFNYLQEDLISVNDSKCILTEWRTTLGGKEQTGGEVNRIMIEKFMLFNEEIQNRQFLKDAIIFPSRNGLQVVSGDSLQLMKGEDGINEVEEKVESMDNIKEESDSIANFSQRIIEESQPVYEFIEGQQFNQPRGSDSIIYSEIEIDNNEDGSMKLFGESEELPHEEPQPQEATKDDILELIEDYTLNPEAIKQIALRIKYLPTGDLERLKGQQSGEIAYVIEGQLRNRGILFPPEINGEYFFVDESKIYERVRNKRIEEKEKEVVIPQFSSQFLKQWLRIILRAAGEEKLSGFAKRISVFCKRMLLEMTNIHLLIGEVLTVITMDNNQFELKFQQDLTFTKKHTPEYYRQILVDQIFGVMIEARIALPVIFYGYWDAVNQIIVPRTNQSKSESIMEVLLSTLIRCNEKQSAFLKNLLQYTEALNKVTRYQYPYLQIQDSLTFSKRVVDELSQRMHLAGETFSDNQKHLSILRVMFYLQVKCYQELLGVELGKTAEVVRKCYQKEESVMMLFRKNYSSEEGLEVERKAEIYWQLRKSKNADEHNGELIFCRKMLTDLASVVLQKLKEDCFSLYYKGEELSMREELLYLKRKLTETRHYSEKYELELEFRQKQKRYCFWRRNLVNLIIVEEIVPAVEEVSGEFLQQIRQTTELLSFLYGSFHEISKNTPIIFRQSAEYYKLVLAYELLKREEQQTFHSMSTLKTIPSIQSTRQFQAGRRRSSLIRHSIFQINCVDTASIVKKGALMLTLDALALQPKNPLFAIHAKHADMQTKLKYLRQENKLGEKIIEVKRESLWSDTAPHLDHNFGNYDVKIKISGELGIDYGGVTREWLSLIVKEILDPRLGLFQLNANGLAFQPSKFSYLVPNHLEMFHKFGILVGKAMKENWLLEINFTKSFLKHILGALLYVEDLEDLEPDTAKGLLWILKNYVDEDLGLNFTYEQEVLESKKTVELVPGGTEVFVNQMNKKQYVKKLAYTKMTESIREQSLAFISGVEKVISIQMLRLFNYREMGKYFAGTSTISIPEMRQFAKYEGYAEDNQNVQWFWEVMSTLSQEDKAEFLFFLTGSYRVPYSGFKENPITINKMTACKDYLPVAHTCFSIIDLPEYSSMEKLERMLKRAVKEGKGFTVS